jgi:SNF2 family DNA or RNA helicase
MADIHAELSEDAKHIHLSADWRYKEICETIPGLNFQKSLGHWRMPVSWSGCWALKNTFKENIEVGPNLSAWAQRELAERVQPALELREATDADLPGNEDLYPHQRAGVNFLMHAKQALLGDEPGLGKTVQAIRTIRELEKREPGSALPALIVAPTSLRGNWAREFHHWWPEVEVLVVSGSAAARRKKFDRILNPKEGDTVPQVVIMGWESLRGHSRLAPYGNLALVKCIKHGGEDPKITSARCEVEPGELNAIPFKSAVADEVHRSLNPQSKQTRALWSATAGTTYRIGMTGTPISKNVMNLWTIMHWLSPEEWPTRTRWVDRYLITSENYFGGMVVHGLKPETRGEFDAGFFPRFRRNLKKVVLPFLPDKVYEVRAVEMSTKQAKAYKQMKEKMLARLDNEQFLQVKTQLSQTTRLLQFASAYAEIEEREVTDPQTGVRRLEEKVRLSEPSSVIDTLMSDIDNGDFEDISVAVSAVSSQLINLLSARLTKKGIDHGLVTGAQTTDERDAHVRDFQEGKTRWILFTTGAGGVGITLTAASVLVRLQRPWSIIEDLQANDRVHRIGSEIHDKILIIDYITTNTVQHHVGEVLDKKAEQMEEIVQDKERMKKFLMAEWNGDLDE